MYARPRIAAIAALAAFGLAACAPDSPTTTPTDEAPTGDDTAMAQNCLPVPGDSLVALIDDQQLQNADNIIPAVNAEAADDAVLDALNAVSAALDTQQLIQLNQAVDVDRQTSSEAARQWVDDNDISTTSTGSGTIVIGAANFNENITLAEVYAAVLSDAGFSTSVQDIGNRETYLPALIDGTIHVVPEYAATLAEFLNVRESGDGADPVASGDIDATASALQQLGEPQGITFGDAAAAQNQNAFAVTDGFAAEYGVTTLSELAEICGPIVLGGPPECPERPFCQIGLEQTYGVEVGEFLALDAGGPLTKSAITQGDVAVGLVFSSDAALG